MARFFRASVFIFSCRFLSPQDAGRRTQSEDLPIRVDPHPLRPSPSPHLAGIPLKFRRGRGSRTIYLADATSRVYTYAVSRREETAGVGPRRNAVLIISRTVIYIVTPGR